MDQLNVFCDERLQDFCAYCGGHPDTRDHVPSRILLAVPFPENLPVVPACFACNNGFSRDEEYFACLVACALAGSTDPDRIQNPRIVAILKRSAALRALLEATKSEQDGRTVFAPDEARVANVIRKLAIGHASFELGAPITDEPTELIWWPLELMSPEQRDNFNDLHVLELYPEVGSRAMLRAQVLQLTLSAEDSETHQMGLVVNDWVEVQEGTYRYLAIQDAEGVRVRIVIAEFLAAEVRWDDQG